MTTTRALYESLSFIGSNWPKDSLRPDSNFGQSLIRAAERCLTATQPSGPPPPQTASSQGVSTRINTRSLDYRELLPEETKVTERAIAALNAIKNGNASKKYPLPQNLARPASNPEYYERLGKMLDRAAKGENMNFTMSQRIRLFFGMQI